MEFIDRDELIGALRDWVLEQSTPFGALLVRRGCFDDDVRTLLESILERQLATPGGMANANLASIAQLATDVVRARKDPPSTVNASLQSSLAMANIDETLPHEPLKDLDTPVLDLPTKPGATSAGGASNGTVMYGASDDASFGLADSAVVRQRVGDKTVVLFGDYQLHEELGRGGMGVVYRATQRSLKRIVALKMIKSGELSSRVEVDRFRTEAEAAAKLDHPNIVPVYEIGELNGQHYFSMGYVDGQSLSALVKDGPMNPTEAAHFVEQAARAVQHAHDRGVVHRDLKPANILLQRVDSSEKSTAVDPQPSWTLKVADFGLAKQINAREGMTHTGDVLGTPGYMAPEQALGKKETGPIADVYSLGAVLYHLVTGRPPFQAASPMETLRQVIDIEPVSVRALNPAITKDLETICHKCLQKDPTRRYPSAAALADDLARTLRGEPIAARPVSTVERSMRWAKRRPAIASLSAAVVIAIAAGIAGTSVYAMRANVLAEKASDEAQRATIQANIASDNEKLAKDEAKKAETEFRRAKKAIDDYFTAVSESQELKQKYPGMHEFRIKLLNKAEQYYTDFLKERGNDGNLQADAAKAFFNRAFVAKVIGRTADARTSHESALAIRVKLARDHPTVTAYASDLAHSHINLAILQSETGDAKAALASYGRAVAIAEKLACDNTLIPAYASLLASAHSNLALLHGQSGNAKAALGSYAKALAILQRLARDKPAADEYAIALATSHNNCGILLGQQGDVKAALASAGKALVIREKLARDNPNTFEYASDLANSYASFGVLQHKTGEVQAALASYIKALAIREKLARDNPTVAAYANELARSHNNLGALLNETGDANAALTSYLKALAIKEKLARDNPTVTQYASALAGSHNNLGDLQYKAGDGQAALVSFGKALAIRERLARDNPSAIEYAGALADSYSNLGLVQGKSGNPKAALASYSKALTIQEKLARDNPTVMQYAVDLGDLYYCMGNLVRDTLSPRESLTHFANAFAALRGPAKVDAIARQTLCNSHWGRGQAFVQLERLDEAIADFDAALQLDNGSDASKVRKDRDAALARTKVTRKLKSATVKEKAPDKKGLGANPSRKIPKS